MLVFDAHLDLAMNALHWNRDLTLTVPEIRALEAGMTEKGRAAGTVCFPEMREGEVCIAIATLIARVARAGNPLRGYATAEIAYAVAQGQRHYYTALDEQGVVRILKDWPSLAAHAAEWGVALTPPPAPPPRGEGSRTSAGSNGPPLPPWEGSPTPNAQHPAPPLGIILSMEGADPVLGPEQIPAWWEQGLRAIGPSHYGVSNYAHGTATPGGLTSRGPALLKAMEAQRMILDVTHLADDSFWQALEIFGGSVLASHSNCRALVPGDRQFSDEQIRALIERGAVIGMAMDAWMLYPGWIKGETHNSVVDLRAVADNIDHICQLAGNARHVGIGTDLDGGYGTEQCPNDLDTIFDLQKIPGMLRARGYAENDIEGIMHGNWLRFFREAWGGE